MGSLWGPAPDEETNARAFADAVAAFRAAKESPTPKQDSGWREQMKRANAIRDQRRASAADEAGAAPGPTAAAPSSAGWREQMRVANAARDRRAQELRKQHEPAPAPEPLPHDSATSLALAAFLSRVAPAVSEQLAANLCDAGDFGLGMASGPTDTQPTVSSVNTVTGCQAAAETACAAGEWSDAVLQLTSALRIVANDALKTRQLNLELRAELLSRRAACFLQEERWKDASADAREALRIDPDNAGYRKIEKKASAMLEQQEHPLPAAEFHQYLKPNVQVTVLVPGARLGVHPGKLGVLSHQNEDGTWRVDYADGRIGDVEPIRLRRTRAGGRQLSDSSWSA